LVDSILLVPQSILFGELAKERQFNTYVNYVIFPSYEIHQRLGLLRYTISGERLEEEMPFRNFLSGRILWDEGMAGVAHSWSEANPGGLMIGLVGADHIKFRNGIPGRFARLAKDTRDCTSVIINPTLIDSRPSGSVANVAGSDSSQFPDRITLQLRYLKDNVDASSEAARSLPQSTGGVMPFADYIVVS
jgi:Haem-binding uptake, Tiki superfamily, ChaN